MGRTTMDLLSLPETVQRKIASLLDQSTTISTVATLHAAKGSADLARSPGVDQSARSDLYDTLPDPTGYALRIKTKPHAIAARLKSASAAVVDAHFLGSECMQVALSATPSSCNDVCITYCICGRTQAAAAQARRVLEQGRQARLGGGKQGWQSSQVW